MRGSEGGSGVINASEAGSMADAELAVPPVPVWSGILELLPVRDRLRAARWDRPAASGPGSGRSPPRLRR